MIILFVVPFKALNADILSAIDDRLETSFPGQDSSLLAVAKLAAPALGGLVLRITSLGAGTF